MVKITIVKEYKASHTILVIIMHMPLWPVICLVMCCFHS